MLVHGAFDQGVYGDAATLLTLVINKILAREVGLNRTELHQNFDGSHLGTKVHAAIGVDMKGTGAGPDVW
jgi:hypothetical protein